MSDIMSSFPSSSTEALAMLYMENYLRNSENKNITVEELHTKYKSVLSELVKLNMGKAKVL